jgi:hypothetical protein
MYAIGDVLAGRDIFGDFRHHAEIREILKMFVILCFDVIGAVPDAGEAYP